MKKIIAILMAAFLVILMSACSKNSDTPTDETTTSPVTNETQTNPEISSTVVDTTASYIPETTTESVDTKPDLSNLSKTETIDMYKSAAKKSDKNITSVQKISLDNIVINDGKGIANSVIGMVKPIISGVISGSSTEFNGITGGYTQLCDSDVKEATAIQKDSNTIIKLKLNEQTDKGQMSEKSGSVGHAISVIGDLSTVLGKLSDSGLPVEISNENVSATYKNACVSVTLDKDGNIISGTWEYTVTLELINFKVAGSAVEKTAVTINNVITHNGGFSE